MNVLEKILEEKELAAIKDLVEENEKCLNQCEGACGSIKNGMCNCDDGVLVQAIRKMQDYLDVVTDTNVGGDNDTEEKIREHIAECLHRIDNIRSFIGNKKYSDEAKCRKNIDVLKKSIVAMEEYLRFKKRNDKDDWIPVEEGLPEINKKVLATVEHSSWISDFNSEWVPEDEKIYYPETQGTYLAYINENNVWIYMDEEGSENICDKEFGIDMERAYDVATHWQPLPEPYKGEEAAGE